MLTGMAVSKLAIGGHLRLSPTRDASPAEESMRRVLFGVQPGNAGDPLAELRDAAKELLESTVGILEQAAVVLAGSPLDEGVKASLDEALRAHIGRVATQASLPASEGLAVALIGRTTAGKSTLLEALCGGDGSRIGRGQQRVTRDVVDRPVLDCPGVTLIDTPGVGALDGADDRELALEQLARADLVMWVAPNQGTQEDTARPLRLIAELGKPILVVMNCRRALDDPRYEFALQDFLDDPADVFVEAEGFLEGIRRQLRQAGARPFGEFLVHAQAAFMASRMVGGDADRLREASRISELLGFLGEARSQARPRMCLAVADSTRRVLVEADALLSEIGAALESTAVREREFDQRLTNDLGRVIQEWQTKAEVGAGRVIVKRRSWIDGLTVDQLGAQFNGLWADEVKAMDRELQEMWIREHQALERRWSDAARSARNEFEAIPVGHMRLPNLEEKWANRVVRIGGRVAVPVFAGVIGGFFLGPPGALAFSAIAGLIAGGLADWVGELFKSEADILRKRREKARPQVNKLLDATSAVFHERLQSQEQAHRGVLWEQSQARQRDAHCLEETATAVGEGAVSASELRHLLDGHTARAVLRVSGRPSEADAVVGVVRYPGHVMALKLKEPGFSAAAIFPPESPEPIAVLPEVIGRSAVADCGRVLLGLARDPFEVDRTSQGVEFALTESLASGQELAIWEHVCATVSGAQVRGRAVITEDRWRPDSDGGDDSDD